MIDWTHRSIIVPKAQAQLARDLCAALAGPGGEGMFTTGLSADGKAPATHWISAGLIDAQFAALLPLGDTVAQQAEMTVFALAQQAGMTVTLDQVQALLAAVVVTELEPLAAIEAQGLVLVSED